MEMRRRNFAKLIATAGLACLGAGLGLARRLVPTRVVRAVGATRFPGKVRKLDEAQILDSGKWKG